MKLLNILKKINKSYIIIDSSEILRNPKNVLLDWYEN